MHLLPHKEAEAEAEEAEEEAEEEEQKFACGTEAQRACMYTIPYLNNALGTCFLQEC
jgi:hypothetical protein